MTGWALTRCLTRCAALPLFYLLWLTYLLFCLFSFFFHLAELLWSFARGWRSEDCLVNINDYINLAIIWIHWGLLRKIRMPFVSMPFVDEQMEPVDLIFVSFVFLTSFSQRLIILYVVLILIWRGLQILSLYHHTEFFSIWCFFIQFISICFSIYPSDTPKQYLYLMHFQKRKKHNIRQEQIKSIVYTTCILLKAWPLRHVHWEINIIHLVCLSEAVNNTEVEINMLV